MNDPKQPQQRPRRYRQTGRIAIFGHHGAAMDVASYLHSREFQLLIVDNDEEYLVRARDLGYDTAQLDYHDDNELSTLGFGVETGTVFSLFPNDAENVFLIISIRALAPQTRVLTIAQHQDAIPRLYAAGAHRVIDIHEITGRRIWDMLSRPLVNELLETTLFGGESMMNLAEVMVGQGGLVDQRLASELTLDRDYDLILIGVVDASTGEQRVVTTAAFQHRLQPGDVLLVIGHDCDIRRFREQLNAATGQDAV